MSYFDKPNYVVFQGAMMCVSLVYYHEQHETRKAYTDDLYLEGIQFTIKYDPNVLHGQGGFCVPFEINGKGARTLRELREFNKKNNVHYESFDLKLIVAEPNHSHFNLIDVNA